MKRILVALTVGLIGLITNSCQKGIDQFLDKAPGVDVSENTIFTSRQQLDYFLTTIYKYGIPSNLAYRDASLSSTGTIVAADVVHPSTDMTDESDASEADFIAANTWNAALILPSNIISKEDYRYYTRWICIRQINIVLKRIGEVPDITEAYKNQVIGEVKSIRAWLYLEMVKRYGGVPIVDQLYTPGVLVDIPRNTIEECFNYIVKDCDDAISAGLPAVQTAASNGRITRMVPYAIKARALLYAASPLFNTATPYLSLGSNNKFICYGNTDNNRWKLAADAAKAALNEAATSGSHTLVDDPTKRNPTYPDNGTPPVPGNYQNSWEVYNNSEIILAFQGYPSASLTNTPWNLICSVTTGTGAGWGGPSVTLNFLRKYEKVDGTPQSWDAAGGSDLMAKYRELDPRFKQTVGYNRSYFTTLNPTLELYDGGKHYTKCKGGNWMKKMIQTRLTPMVKAEVNDIVLRLNELYLNHAEALNEASGPMPEAYAAVNRIRNRSGMPDLPTGLSKEQFRARVRNERAIEMAFDDHRFWDIRRWLIAEEEGVMRGNMDGLQVTQVGSVYSWKPYTFEIRTFNRNMYLHPFPLNEVLKGDLVQNPGW